MSLETQLHDIYRAHQNGEYISSELSIRKLLNLYPNNTDVLRLGAITALSLNQIVTAHARMEQARQHTVETAEMANTRGNILKASGEWAASEAAYKKAMKLDEDYEPARANFIDLLIESGQADRAITELDVQTQAYNEDSFMLYSRTVALMNIGEYEKALRIAEKLSSLKDAGQLALLRTRLFFHLGRYSEMVAAVRSVPPESEYLPEALSIALNALAMSDDWESGEGLIEEICKSERAQPAVFVKAATLLFRGRREQLASDIIVRASRLFGNHADILALQADHAIRSGATTKGYELFKGALKQRPGDFSMLLSAAQTALTVGAYAECHELLQGAFQQAPNNQFLLALSASLFRKCGQDYKALYDYDKFIVAYDLPAPDGYSTIEQFNEALKNALEAHHVFQQAPLNQSLRGGVQTDKDLFFVDDPILKSFFKAIEAPLQDYMTRIGTDLNHPFLRRNTGKCRVNGAWSVRLSSDGHHVNHVHPMGWISSSYYVDVPQCVDTTEKHEGWIKFGEPAIKSLNLSPEKWVQPKAGRLVLFPSYMWHGTVPFSGNQTRLTLPFDVVPA